MPAPLVFAGKQRRGIHELLDERSSFSEHIQRALKGTFPLSAETPLPQDTRTSALFLRDTPIADIISFWDDQLSSLEKLVSDCAPDQKRWNEKIRSEIAPAAANFQTAAISQLFRHFGLQGQRWLWQFANGFPITGSLSQKHLSPESDKEVSRIHQSDLYDAARARFKERANHCGTKDAQLLWDEAVSQWKKGWLSEPIPLAPDGNPTTWKSSSFNIAFRFGVTQADKVRACDDLRHSMTSLSCAVLTPIKLASWGHIVQLSHLLTKPHSADWGLFKADHEAAYKQLPIDPADQRNAIIALRHPRSKKWFGFITRALIFGAVAAVLHYNAFSRAWTALVNRTLGIPLVCFFDDFATMIQLCLGNRALAVFSHFCEKLGFRTKPGKSAVGNRIVFLGLLGAFPTKGGKFQLSISLTDEKRSKWAAPLASYLKAGAISHRCLEKLLGRLGFPQTSLFGKFARTQLRPLYQKFYRRVYNTRLAQLERSNLECWLRVIADFTPRPAGVRPSRADWLIYTDAATDPANLCALLFRGDRSRPTLDTLATARVDTQWIYLFRHTALIYGLELLALVAFFELRAPFLRGSCCWVYLDNNNCLAALTRGDSNTDAIAVLVAHFWSIVQRFDICIWFSRVRSKLNPADLPTRKLILPFKPRYSCSLSSIRQLFHLCRRNLAKMAPRPRKTFPPKKPIAFRRKRN